MKLFASREIFRAYDFVREGGQALHVYGAMRGAFPDAPGCFKRSRRWGHLLDQNEERLVETARRLGVKRVVVGRPGNIRQHVDLCGRPLERAIEQCGIPNELRVKSDEEAKRALFCLPLNEEDEG